MFKPPIRAPLRQALCLSASAPSSCSSSQRCRPASVPAAAAAFVARRSTRHLTTAAPGPRASSSRSSWKSRALRWGLAAGAVYYYNTGGAFAEGPSLSSSQPLRPLIATKPPQQQPPSPSAPDADGDSSPSRRPASQDPLLESPLPSAASTGGASEVFGSDDTGEAAGGSEDELPGGAQELEEEASNEGAFNPETGEINWDCPCLGGMAHGPCGAEFRAAFSCFVYSKEEPKGMDCIDKFKGMQECFQKHPDVYGTELDDDEEHARQGAGSNDDADELPATPAAATTPTTEEDDNGGSRSEPVTAAPVAHAAHERSDDGSRAAALVAAPDPDLALSADTASAPPTAPAAAAESAATPTQEQEPDRLVPKAAHDEETR